MKVFGEKQYRAAKAEKMLLFILIGERQGGFCSDTLFNGRGKCEPSMPFSYKYSHYLIVSVCCCLK